ncbi:Eukaryotic translation initiation factor 3 subunit J [Cladobotryum mycophilum]|uniref:Eukaryotic translation initiation factor 3 subunit J n=1 Tax=Cladobotryum mycophilum TaxID=491253 RepID=A0ABR0S686_9HYPO
MSSEKPNRFVLPFNVAISLEAILPFLESVTCQANSTKRRRVTSTLPPSLSPLGAVRRRQFEDEEDDEDVLDSWDAAEDSEVEREKTRKAAEAKEKADAAAAANKKSKTQRIAEHQAERKRLAAEDDESDEDETEAERRERLRLTEKESDLKHAEDLFGEIGISSGRSANTPATTIAIDPKDPGNTVNLATLPVFSPQTKAQFERMRGAISPLITANSKKAHYGIFLEEFVRELVKDMSSDQIKKIASALTRASNEKMKEEKTTGGKKTKAAKTKTSLVANRPNATADVSTYDEEIFGDDDFM